MPEPTSEETQVFIPLVQGEGTTEPPPIVPPPATNRVAIDPITRIEGHLRIEAQIEDGYVQDAWSSGMMFRGIELIMPGRDPRDAWVFTQRICGV